jgi:hypothetical protein
MIAQSLVSRKKGDASRRICPGGKYYTDCAIIQDHARRQTKNSQLE